MRMSRRMDQSLQALARLRASIPDDWRRNWLSGIIGRLLTVSNYLAEVSGNDRLAPPSAADDC